MKHSIINIQILRAIAAFLVVIDHSFAVPLKPYLNKDEFFLVHKYFNNLGEFAVLIFF
jgi:peptidoglycan/LPS O-acetylase OafA/YrhL